MTEIEYRKLLIDSVRAGDYPEKDGLLELLNICSLRFEKTIIFTRNLWNHFQEYIHICIVPEKMIELKKHSEYLEKMIYEIYPPNDDYELWGVEIKPGTMPDTEDVSQEILFENIRNQIIEEIHAAKYMIWISVAWFTDPVLYQELLKKKEQGLVIEIALDDCDRNHNAEFSLEDDFPVYWITVQSYYQNIMHEKFCVIDLYTSIHGTFNWTKAANYNKEHISIDKNHSTADAFADEFMKLKNKKAPHHWKSSGEEPFLCFDVDCDPRLEFYGEVVGEYRDLLDELFDQSLIKLFDVGFLTGDEVLQFLNPVHDFFPVVAINFGLFLLVAELENLVGDGIVVLFIVCLFDELLLQFQEPTLNAVRRECISVDHGLGDVLL